MEKAGDNMLRSKLKDCLRWATIRSERVGRMPPEVTLDDLFQLWVAQKGRCALTDIALQMKGPFGVTIDRIDPRGGYERGNVALVTKRANGAKGDMTLEEFAQLCKEFLRVHRRRGSVQPPITPR